MVPKSQQSGEPLKENVEIYLKSRNILDRLKGVDMLKESGNKQRLLELLYSESWHTRERAAQALASFGESVKDDVLPLLQEGYWFVRAASAYIIGEIKDSRALPQLVNKLKERNETVRSESAKAIAKIIKAYPELAGELNPDDRVLLENTLKDLKEFDLLEEVRKARTHAKSKENTLSTQRG